MSKFLKIKKPTLTHRSSAKTTAKNDTSEGGVERAALATVFGVEEYTEPKTLWNSENKTPASVHSHHTSISTATDLPIIPATSGFGDLWEQAAYLNDDNSVIASDPLLPIDLSDSQDITIFDYLKNDTPNLILRNNHSSCIEQQVGEAVDSNNHEKNNNFMAKLLALSKKKKRMIALPRQTAIITEEKSVIEASEIKAATIEKLLEKLTTSLDYVFMTDFFLTYRAFMTPLQLCKLLVLRFKWTLVDSEPEHRIVRIRTFVTLRHWFLNYFLHDFVYNPQLRDLMDTFLKETATHPLMLQSPENKGILDKLDACLQRLYISYFNTSTDHVKVIFPPPPTQQQQNLEEMVNKKLATASSSKIGQKLSNSVGRVKIDTKHKGNTAVKKGEPVPVMIAGNYIPKQTTFSLLSHGDKRKKRESNVSDLSTSGMNTATHSKSDSFSQSSSHTSYPQQRPVSQVAEIEWSNIQQQKQQQQAGNSTTEEEDVDSIYITPNQQVPTSDSTSTQSDFNSKVISSQLAEKLERFCLEQEEDDDDQSLLSPEEHTFFCIKPLYKPELNKNYLANLPRSNCTTPHSEIDEDEPDVVDITADTENALINSISYNSMAQTSITTESEAVTPHNHDLLPVTTTTPANNTKPLSAQQQVKEMSGYRQTKALPTLIPSDDEEIMPANVVGQANKSHQFAHKTLPTLPQNTTASTVHEEVWKISKNSNRRHQDQRGSGIVVIEDLTKNAATSIELATKPKYHSRIMEFGLENTNDPQYGNYRSLVLNYGNKLDILAQQLCLIEKQVLSGIHWEELMDCRWTKMKTNDNSTFAAAYYHEHDILDRLNVPLNQRNEPGIYSRSKRLLQQLEKENATAERGVEKVINRFNEMCQWVSSEIVKTENIKMRAKVIKNFILLAEECKSYSNFATLLQILLGLQSSSVSRLEKTWKLVGKKHLSALQELSKFTSPIKNWKNIRDCMTQVAEEYEGAPTKVQVSQDELNRTTIKLPFGGCIPFLGIYLSDLVFNAELPNYFPSPRNANTIERRRQRIENVLATQPLVHFQKHRTTAMVIKRVLVFQSLAQRYPFEMEQRHGLYQALLHLKSEDSNTIRKLSFRIEPAIAT